jgi:hypothetical protein
VCRRCASTGSRGCCRRSVRRLVIGCMATLRSTAAAPVAICRRPSPIGRTGLTGRSPVGKTSRAVGGRRTTGQGSCRYRARVGSPHRGRASETRRRRRRRSGTAVRSDRRGKYRAARGAEDPPAAVVIGSGGLAPGGRGGQGVLVGAGKGLATEPASRRDPIRLEPVAVGREDLAPPS